MVAGSSGETVLKIQRISVAECRFLPLLRGCRMEDSPLPSSSVISSGPLSCARYRLAVFRDGDPSDRLSEAAGPFFDRIRFLCRGSSLVSSSSRPSFVSVALIDLLVAGCCFDASLSISDACSGGPRFLFRFSDSEVWKAVRESAIMYGTRTYHGPNSGSYDDAQFWCLSSRVFLVAFELPIIQIGQATMLCGCGGFSAGRGFH